MARERRPALAAAATRRSETDPYTHGQLFDAPVKGLGGRTRFAALCALCAELDLGDMYEFGVMESDPSVKCVRKLLEWRLGALPHKKRSSKSRDSKNR